MSNNTYLLTGYIEFLPVETGFVTPLFSNGNGLFIQRVNKENIIEDLEAIMADTEYVQVNSNLIVSIGDKCLFGFKHNKVRFDNYENLVVHFIEAVLPANVSEKVKDCIYDFVGYNFSPQQLVDEIQAGRVSSDPRKEEELPEKEIRVAIAEDHRIFRKGVILSLRPYSNIKFVQEADNGQELLDGIEESKPDIVLMDLKMPVKDGIQTTEVISEKYPAIHTLALTMYEDERIVKKMMELGASGYLLKSADPREIGSAILSIHETGFYFNSFVNRIILNKNIKAAADLDGIPSSVNIQLSEREKELLDFICKEFTTVEIAERMGLSVRTIENIRMKLMERVNAKNIAGLIIFAVKNKLIK